MARNLRFAVSVFFGVLTAALCALWTLSYMCDCGIGWADANNFSRSIWSRQGKLRFFTMTSPSAVNVMPGWSFAIREPNNPRPSDPQFVWRSESSATLAVVPYWFLAIVAASAAALPWTRFRFSLRTLLIATTLVAVTLGLVMWLTP